MQYSRAVFHLLHGFLHQVHRLLYYDDSDTSKPVKEALIYCFSFYLQNKFQHCAAHQKKHNIGANDAFTIGVNAHLSNGILR